MAKCEEGYLCEVCGRDVENLFDSDLYLRYVIGMVDPEVPAVTIEGDFDKRLLDAGYVRDRETLVTRGYRRLKELAALDLPIIDYPLPEVRANIVERSGIAR